MSGGSADRDDSHLFIGRRVGVILAPDQVRATYKNRVLSRGHGEEAIRLGHAWPTACRPWRLGRPSSLRRSGGTEEAPCSKIALRICRSACGLNGLRRDWPSGSLGLELRPCCSNHPSLHVVWIAGPWSQ